MTQDPQNENPYVIIKAQTAPTTAMKKRITEGKRVDPLAEHHETPEQKHEGEENHDSLNSKTAPERPAVKGILPEGRRPGPLHHILILHTKCDYERKTEDNSHSLEKLE